MTADHSDRERLLRESGRAFSGRITASVTHEINNTLSTLGELSGLLEDLAWAAGEKGEAVGPDKLQQIAERLTLHVRKGAEIVKRLNRFAHSSDVPVKTFDCSEFVGLITELAGPFLRRRERDLETQLATEQLMIETNPFILQQLIFLCLEMALRQCEASRTIEVLTRSTDSCAIIQVDADGPSDDAGLAEDMQLIRVLAEEIGGVASHQKGDQGGVCVTLTFPRC